MPLRFADASTTILTAVAPVGATTLFVSSTSSFPQPLAVDDFFVATLSNPDNTVREIVKVTEVDSISRTFTVVRGYDDSIALEWPVGTKIEIRASASLFKEVINSVVTAPVTAEDNAVMVFDSANNKSKSSNIKALNNNASYQYVVTPEVPFKAGTSVVTNPPTNQIDYTTPGTFTFVVPSGVTSVSAVAVGGGGGGNSNTATNGVAGGGGGGGALHWRTFSVTPGESLTVVVGAGGTASTAIGTDNATAGGSSSISRGATNLVLAGGGAKGVYNSAGTTAAGGVSGFTTLGGGGGNGGSGGGGASGNASGGGGGAGGYSGNGGNGSTGTTYSGVTAGAGGGGSGSTGFNTNTQPTFTGGGVGILGEGTSGAAPTAAVGQAGNPGSGGVAGLYGGGGVGAEDDSTSGLGSNGIQGAVRIIWGPGRTYPSTLTTNQTVVNVSYTGQSTPEVPYVAPVTETRVKDSIVFKATGSNSVNSAIDLYNSNNELQGSIIATGTEFSFTKPLRNTAFSGSTLDLFGVGNIRAIGDDVTLTTRSQAIRLNETLKRQTFSINGFEFKTDNGIITPVNKTKITYANETTSTWTVPTGVNYIFVKMWGGGGSGGAYGGWRQGSVGGAGGYTHGIIPVTPGDTVTIRAGGRAAPRWGATRAFPDGGGCSTGGGDNRYAGSGGGSSSIRVTSFIGNDWCMFAGGGGGGGSVNGYALNSGGAGGGLIGQPGVYSGYNENNHNGKGGTQTAGGAAGTGNNTTGGAGSFNQGGTHQSNECYGGGGGGGYYGGGSGAYGNSNSMGGGGGGSGFVHPSITFGVTLTGNLHTPPNSEDPDLLHDGAFHYACGGEEDGYGGPGVVVIYY